MKAHWLCVLIWTLLPLGLAFCKGSYNGQISGKVNDVMESPITGATVTLLSLHRVIKTKTNISGAFQLDNLELGAWSMEITAPDYAKKTLQVNLPLTPSEQTISVVLTIANMQCDPGLSVNYESAVSTGPKLTGRLSNYDSARTPIAYAVITILRDTYQQAPVILRSDRRGHFLASGLVPDYYDIQISRHGYQKEELKHFLIPRENKVLLDGKLVKLNQMVVCQ